jgi:3-hydroxybutyryl-CoA dehydrogenase
MTVAVPAITKIGIIGAGQMGNGIAHVCALAGLPVVPRSAGTSTGRSAAA